MSVKYAVIRYYLKKHMVYKWRYSFDEYDWQEASHLVIRTPNKTKKVILYFNSEDNGIGHCPFNTEDYNLFIL